MKIIMVGRDNEPVDVDEKDFKAALKNGLEPAAEYADRDGKISVVKKSDRAAAEGAGLVQKAIYEGQQAKDKIEFNPSKGETFVRGLANAGTLGFSDEIGGAAQALKGLITKGSFKDVVKDYRRARDDYRESDDEAYNKNKAIYGAGFAIPTVLSLGAALPTVARAGIKQAAVTGAKYGAVGAAGGDEADLTKGEFKKFAKDVAVGGVIGAALGGGLEKGARALSAPMKLPPNIGASTDGLTPELLKKFTNIAEKSNGDPKLIEALKTGAFSGKNNVRVAQTLSKALEEPLEFGKRIKADGLDVTVKNLLRDADVDSVDLGRTLKRFGEQRAAKAAGGDSAKAIRLVDRMPGGVQGFGRDLLESGIVSGNKTKEEILDKAAQVASGAGKRLGEILTEFDTLAASSMTFKPQALRRVLSRANKEVLAPLQESPATSELADRLSSKYVDKLQEFTQNKKTLSFNDLVKERRLLDKTAFTESGLDKPLNDQLQAIRRIFNEELLSDAAKVAPKELIEDYARQNRLFGVAKTATKLTQEQVGRGQKNRTISLSDYITGSAGGIAGAAAWGPIGVIGAPIVAGLNKLARERGNQILADGASRLAKFLGSK